MLIILLFILSSFCFVGFRINSTGCDVDYLSKGKCNGVKGFFILLVFIRHINQYIMRCGCHPDNLGDWLYFKLDSSSGQLIVVMFLFFSGFGIMESFKHKGTTYIRTMPQKRILTTLVNFDIAVLFFIVLNLFLGKSMTIKQAFLSFMAWDSVGNSSWYIFCILLCYLLSYIVLSIYGKRYNSKSVYKYVFFPIFILSIIAIIVLSYFKEPYWYNTMLCFPFGMLYSIAKDKIECLIQSYYYQSLFVLFATFFLMRYIPLPFRWIMYNVEAMVFALIVVTLMMKVRSENKCLQWLGQKLFPLYIYQRLAMIAIYEMPGGKDFIMAYPIVYLLICFAIVVLIASQYHRWQISLG